MARTSRVLISVVILGAIGIGAYVFRDRWVGQAERLFGVSSTPGTQQASGTRGSGRRRGSAQSTGPTAVLTAAAKLTDVPVYIDGVGSVKPLNTVTVRPQVSGKLVEIDFEEGQDIKKGDVIARIDDAVYKASLDQAIAKKAQDQALLQSAQTDLERYQRLVQSSSGTQQQVDTARFQVAQYQAQVQSDQAAIESAQATLDYTTIAAPIDGRTGIRNVDIGNIVSSTDTTGIVTLSQIRPITVVFSVPQQQLAKVNAANAEGALSVQALSGGEQKVVDTGALSVVDNQVDTTTGTVKLKATFPNEKLALWPGAFVNARLLLKTMKGVVVIPTAAVQRGPNGTFVYLLQPDQTVLMKTVKVGQQDDVQAVITDGVAAGDTVVTTGFARLQSGSKVEVSQPATPAATDAAAPAPSTEAKPRRHHNGNGANKPTDDGAPPGHSADSAAMSVSSLFINRPIATSLLAAAILLGGLLGYSELPVAPLPQVDFPTIRVTTQLPGADPDTMASLVTAPLERPLGQIPSLASMTSSSAFGISQITLQFDLGRNIDGAAQDVQAAINAAGSTLPKTLPYPPTYSKVNPADTPIITLALRSTSYSIRNLSDFADTMMAQKLSQVSGVGNVSIQGGVKPAIRIQANLPRLASYGLALEDIRSAIVAASVAGAKGALDGTHQSFTLAANDQIVDPEAYKSVIVAYRNNAPIILKDVADVVEGLENTRVGAWYQGEPAVIIDVMRQPGANVIQTVGDVLKQLPQLKEALPAGTSLDIVNDRTETIRASIHDVQWTLALSVGLVILVVFVFLRTVTATIIAAVALPLSLIATFGVMWFAGFSLDNLSLMALTIGTGFVVDDAIVMIENIARHIEEGDDPMHAALKGAGEISFTIISLTFSLVAVFIPLLFMTGIVGRMFREFALTLTIAVVVSAIISLTLTPMMCARILRKPAERRRGMLAGADRMMDRLIGGYRASLVWAIDRSPLMLMLTVVTLVATIGLYIFIPKGFLPPQDTGLITAVIETEPTTSFESMKRTQALVTDRLRHDQDVTGIVSVVGASANNLTLNTGTLSLVLKPRTDRSSTSAEIIDRLREEVAGMPGVHVTFQSVRDISISTRSSRAPYQYTLTGTDTASVVDWAQKLAAQLQQAPALIDVSSEVETGGGRIFVDVDRETASRLGISMQAVSDTLNDAFGQRQIATIYGQSNQYRVIIEAAPKYQADPKSLDKLYVAGSSDVQVPLNAFSTATFTTAPLVISHDKQFPSVTLSFDLAKGASLSDAVSAVSAAEQDIGMPNSIQRAYSGDAEEFSSSLAGEPWLILAAVVTIYIVLGLLYESAIHPITILSTLPSAGVGALLALMLFGQDLSLIALIGIVLLMGIVKKNAIMMIDFALEAERSGGLPPREAILQASILRFRPIMMTTLAALFGALPLALASGTGAELRMPLGISIVGGLVLSQLLTLYTTPVIYLAFERLRSRIVGRPTGTPAPEATEAGARP